MIQAIDGAVLIFSAIPIWQRGHSAAFRAPTTASPCTATRASAPGPTELGDPDGILHHPPSPGSVAAHIGQRARVVDKREPDDLAHGGPVSPPSFVGSRCRAGRAMVG